MQINILNTFLLVCETKNLTKAASLLNYSQSTVSNHIDKLEEQLKLKLFYRKKYGVELTEEGKIYIKYAKAILESNKDFKKEIRGKKNIDISLNIQESQYLYKYQKSINNWICKHPFVNFKFKTAHSNFYIKEQIENFESDISLITDEYIIPNNLSSKFISEEKLILVSNERYENFNIKDISQCTVLVTEKGCSYREQIEKFFHQYNLSSLQVIEFISIESLKKYLINFKGLALLPEFIVKEEIEKNELFNIKINYDFPPLKTHVIYNSHSTKKEIFSFINDIFLIDPEE